jgi:hypothetical protein
MGVAFDTGRLLAKVPEDMRRGSTVGAEDLVIAALVMAPFTLTLGVVLGWMTWAPSWLLIAVTLIVTVFATLWNAGWRARSE